MEKQKQNNTSSRRIFLHRLHWCVTIVLAILTVAGLVFELFFHRFFLSVRRPYTPHPVGTFTSLQCDYLFNDSLGWGSTNPHTSTVDLRAMVDVPESSTLDPRWQHAKIIRTNPQRLLVAINMPLDVSGKDFNEWTILEENDNGLTARNGNQLLSLSKPSGLLVYTRVDFVGYAPVSIAWQDATMFACR